MQIKLAEFPRVWRPSKGMRRVLAAGWGVKATEWTGRRVTLYFDPDVTFGKDRTGGTRISHMSDLPKGRPLNLPLLITRGKSAMFTVQPLTDAPAPAQARPKQIKPNVEALIENAQEARHNADLDDVARAAAGLTGDELDAVKAVVTARRAELKESAEPEPPADHEGEMFTGAES